MRRYKLRNHSLALLELAYALGVFFVTMTLLLLLWSGINWLKLHPVCRHNLDRALERPTEVAYMCNMVGEIEIAEALHGYAKKYK